MAAAAAAEEERDDEDESEEEERVDEEEREEDEREEDEDEDEVEDVVRSEAMAVWRHALTRRPETVDTATLSCVGGSRLAMRSSTSDTEHVAGTGRQSVDGSDGRCADGKVVTSTFTTSGAMSRLYL